jgi:hypothetical protein
MLIGIFKTGIVYSCHFILAVVLLAIQILIVFIVSILYIYIYANFIFSLRNDYFDLC